MVTRYLDCGCALTDDGSRHWCPSCTAETLNKVSQAESRSLDDPFTVYLPIPIGWDMLKPGTPTQAGDLRPTLVRREGSGLIYKWAPVRPSISKFCPKERTYPRVGADWVVIRKQEG